MPGVNVMSPLRLLNSICSLFALNVPLLATSMVPRPFSEKYGRLRLLSVNDENLNSSASIATSSPLNTTLSTTADSAVPSSVTLPFILIVPSKFVRTICEPLSTMSPLIVRPPDSTMISRVTSSTSISIELIWSIALTLNEDCDSPPGNTADVVIKSPFDVNPRYNAALSTRTARKMTPFFFIWFRSLFS